MKKIKFSFIFALVALLSVGLTGCNSDKGPDAGDFMPISEVIANAKKLTADSGNDSDNVVKGTPNFDVPAGGYDGSDVTITFYHTMGSNLKDVLTQYITEFNTIYPNIHINDSQVGGYDDVRDQINTEITVGNQPNIAYCYPDHVASYNMAKAVATLDNLIDSTASDGAGGVLGLSSEQKADFIKGYYDEGKQFGDGLMYSLPLSKSTEVLYYNKTFFDQHNLSVPTHWFSESESDTTSLEYVCKRIKEIDPNSIPLGYDSEANWFITMAEQCGSGYTSSDVTNHFIFDNPTNKAVLKEFRSWYQKGWITTQTIYGSYTSGLFINIPTTSAQSVAASDTASASGSSSASSSTRSYMSIGSSAGATHQRPTKGDDGYPFEVGIATIPQMSTTYRRVISQGPSLCIFNKKSNPQEVVASWLFVKFLTTNVEFQAEFSMASGYVPVIKSVSENEVYKDWLAKANGGDYIAALSAKVCLEQEDAYYTSPAFNGSSVARDQVGALLTKVLSSTTNKENQMIIDAFKDAIYECEYQA